MGIKIFYKVREIKGKKKMEYSKISKAVDVI
jgi:hypothetical protein